MTELHPAIGKNRFCGPGAIAIVTGLPTDEAAAVIRTITGKPKVFGVSPLVLYAALERCGVTLRDYFFIKPMSLEWFAGHCKEPGTYVVYVTGHYCVVQIPQPGIALVCDNHTIYPITITRYRGRRKRIRAVWKVMP